MKTDQLYGPQTEHVDALLKKVLEITPGRASELDVPTARHAVGVAIRKAGRSETRDAVNAVIWHAARNTNSWVFPWNEPENVIASAIQALVVRDLIGQHGFTQEHYDILTLPVRRVLGRIHPDDAEALA